MTLVDTRSTDATPMDRWWRNDPDRLLYAVIDGEVWPGAFGLLRETDLDWCSLLQGPTAAEHMHDAPFLVELRPCDPLVSTLMHEEYCTGRVIFVESSRAKLAATQGGFERLSDLRNYGQFIASPRLEMRDPPAAIMQVRRHLRTLVMAQTSEDGRRWLFRFHDPRIIAAWLPSCSAADIESAFGPLEAFWAETQGGFYRWTRDVDGSLHTEHIPHSATSTSA